MNSEILVGQAGCAIAEFVKHNESSAVLLVKNGSVECVPSKEARCKAGSCLYVTPWQQRHGLSSRAWRFIGTELLNLYNKDLACQAHPKQ